jgi:hypothetical protein
MTVPGGSLFKKGRYKDQGDGAGIGRSLKRGGGVKLGPLSFCWERLREAKADVICGGENAACWA